MNISAETKKIRIIKMELGPYRTNAYILTCTRTMQSLIIDAPANAPKIIASVAGTQPRYILLTHEHEDHTGALAGLRSRLKVPLGAHRSSSPLLTPAPELDLKDGDIISLGNLQIEVIHTPGHTPGSLCFRTGLYLFAGDTIFPGGPGRTATPEDFHQIVASIKGRILPLPDATRILPGHGPATTVGKVKEEFTLFASRPHSPDLCGDVLWASS